MPTDPLQGVPADLVEAAGRLGLSADAIRLIFDTMAPVDIPWRSTPETPPPVDPGPSLTAAGLFVTGVSTDEGVEPWLLAVARLSAPPPTGLPPGAGTQLGFGLANLSDPPLEGLAGFAGPNWTSLQFLDGDGLYQGVLPMDGFGPFLDGGGFLAGTTVVFQAKLPDWCLDGSTDCSAALSNFVRQSEGEATDADPTGYQLLALTRGFVLLDDTARPSMVIPLSDIGDGQFDYEAMVQTNYWR